jgi:hypothetical protein
MANDQERAYCDAMRKNHPALARTGPEPRLTQWQRMATWMDAMTSAKAANYTNAPVAPRCPIMCGDIPLASVGHLQRRMRSRYSWFRRRRRAAYRACLAMIQFREAALGIA